MKELRVWAYAQESRIPNSDFFRAASFHPQPVFPVLTACAEHDLGESYSGFMNLCLTLTPSLLYACVYIHVCIFMCMHVHMFYSKYCYRLSLLQV